MEKKMPEAVPYIAYEGTIARFERTVKRLVIAVVICIVLLLASNALWLYAWMQYDYEGEVVTTTQDGKGININSVGGSKVDYGAKDSLQTQNETPEE